MCVNTHKPTFSKTLQYQKEKTTAQHRLQCRCQHTVWWKKKNESWYVTTELSGTTTAQDSDAKWWWTWTPKSGSGSHWGNSGSWGTSETRKVGLTAQCMYHVNYIMQPSLAAPILPCSMKWTHVTGRVSSGARTPDMTQDRQETPP